MKIYKIRINFCDKWGWPVTKIKGKPITNLIRKIIHTRKIRLGDLKSVDYGES